MGLVHPLPQESGELEAGRLPRTLNPSMVNLGETTKMKRILVME